MHNLRAAFRSVLSTPGPALVVTCTLALAIAANTAIFSVVSGVLLRPLGYGDDSRLVVLWTKNSNDSDQIFSLAPADYRDLRDSASAFDGQVAIYRAIGSTLTGLEEPIRVGTFAVTTTLFQVLDAQPSFGQFFSDEDEKPGGEKKVVLTHSSWTRRFGANPNIIGTRIELDGLPYSVVGVTKPGFQFPPDDSEAEMYFPMSLSDAVLLDRNHRMFDGIGRLADGETAESASAELSAIASRLAEDFPDTNQGWTMAAEPLRDELLGDLSTTLWVLTGAVLVVMLIACANIANVLIARSTAAEREFAVRAALGARTSDLVKRSLAESLILGMFGTALGLVLAFAGVGLLRNLMPANIPRVEAIAMDWEVLGYALLLSVAATLLFGLLPAIRSLGPDLVRLIKPTSTFGATGARRVLELMVVAQISLAIVLLVSAGLLIRSFTHLSAVDPGFNKEGVTAAVVQLPRSRYGLAEMRPFFEQVIERLEEVPGVWSAGAVSDLPMSDVGLGLESEFTVTGLDAIAPTVRPNADFRLVVPGYFEAMGMTVLEGRDLGTGDATRDGVAIVINETLAKRYFQGVDPIGRTVNTAMLGESEVAGVVSDVRHNGPQSKFVSEIYLPYGRMLTTEMNVVVHSELDTATVANIVNELLTEMDPLLPPARVLAVSDLVSRSVSQPRFNAALLILLALCAATLSSVGTYGIVAYTVARRTGEIGVRMALGANSAATVVMVVRQVVGIVLVGGVLGILGALLATQFLAGLLFEVEPTDPLTYGLALAVAVMVGAIAAWMPARRATRIDPVVALRDG